MIILLCANSIARKKKKTIYFSRYVISNLILCSYILYKSYYIKALTIGIGIYGGLLYVTILTQTFNLFVFILSEIILIFTSFYPRKIKIDRFTFISKSFTSRILSNKKIISNKKGEEFLILEYSLIIVFVIYGVIFLMSSSDLISIFISIELQSYGLYILCSIYRNSESSTSSGLTYFLLGGLSSCFILLGSASLYANTGTTNLESIYIIGSISELEDYSAMTYWYLPYYWHFSFIILCTGFLFKISASPFHFWSPDVYDGTPTIVTAFVAIIGKISIFILILELLFYTEFNIFDFSWNNVLLISSFLSLLVGALLGITQFRIKRLFAYSSINHVGFILLALCINSSESIQSYIFYIIQYTVSNLNGFISIIIMASTLYIYIDRDKQHKDKYIDINNSPIQLISQIKGYFYINPVTAVSFAITLFSFMGIPPMLGFFAKQMVLSAALDKGYIFMAIFAVITSAISAAYYLNIVKQMFFFKDAYVFNPIFKSFISIITPAHNFMNKFSDIIENKKIKLHFENIAINSSLSSTISIISLLILTYLFTPNVLLNNVAILTTVYL